MSHPRNAWYVASWTQQLSDNRPIATSILGEPIVLWLSDGRVVAMEDRCIHRLAPLSIGRCEGPHLRCMYHGLLYNAAGKVLEIPGQDRVPPRAQVKTYPVVARHSWVWVWLGDPRLADESLIPTMVGLNEPGWLLGHGSLDYEADAKLINDNLLDFSHTSFVHADSFQGGMSFASELPKVVTLDRGVRIDRWVQGYISPRAPQGTPPLDLWMTYDFLVPGILLMSYRTFIVGTAQACNLGPPDYGHAVGPLMVSFQAVTPLSEGKSRYYYMSGTHRDGGDENFRDAILSAQLKGFAEDKHMIENQQRMIKSASGRQYVLTAHDRAVTLFDAIMRRISAGDRESVPA